MDQRNLLGKDFKVYGNFENPLFLAKDVAEWIDYDKSSMNKMIRSVDDDEKVCLVSEYCSEGIQANTPYWFLTEDGLYEVLMQSRKPIAKKFKKEVKKILKSIRMNGMYVAQAKVQEKMFNTMKIEMTGLVDEIVLDKISQIEEKCSDYYRPSSSEKQRVLIKLNATKWEDIPVEVLRDSLNIIDESIRAIKADRITNQISLFEVACSK